MKTRISIFIFSCLVCIIQCKEQTLWETYTGESFIIDYPLDWDIDSSGQFDVQTFTCFSPETDNNKETLSLGIVLAIDSTDLKTAAETFIQRFGFNTSKAKELNIGNKPALYIENDNEGVLFKNYFLKKENTLYYIFYAGYPQAIKLWEKQAKSMVKSFRIIEK